MKINVLAIASALFALSAAAVQASPATVVPNTVHAIGRDAEHVVNGTAEGVGAQYRHDVAAGRRVVKEARHGTLLKRHHRHLVSRKTQSHTVQTHTVETQG